MNDLLATVEQLANRVGEGPITAPEDIALAEHMLAMATEQARLYGSSDWQRFNAPKIAKMVVLEAASRGYNNPAGYALERGDEITFQRTDTAADGVAFTRTEIAMVASVAYRGGIVSVPFVRDDTMSEENLTENTGTGGGVNG